MKSSFTSPSNQLFALVALLLVAAASPAAAQEFDQYGGFMGIESPAHKSYSGVSTHLEASKLIDSKAKFIDNALVGKYLVPDVEQEAVPVTNAATRPAEPGRSFKIIKNTKTEIFTDPADGDMTARAKVGATYKTRGFFAVEKIGNRWWFITPEGHGFISLSVACTGILSGDGADRNGKTYTYYAKKKHTRESDKGSEYLDRWCRATIARLKGWGWNTIGFFSYDVQRYNQMPYYVTTRLTNYALFEGPSCNIWHGNGTNIFPDIYHPDLMNFMDNRMKGYGLNNKDNPWVLVVYPDELDELRGLTGGIHTSGWRRFAGPPKRPRLWSRRPTRRSSARTRPRSPSPARTSPSSSS